MREKVVLFQMALKKPEPTVGSSNSEQRSEQSLADV
jgi:hypothetical protein